MPGKLAGKIALITGGSTGMALSTAEKFIAEGAVVYITGRRPEVLDEAVERLGPRARGVVADGASLDDINRLFDRIGAEEGRLDVLFASAAAGTLVEPLTEVTLESYDRIFGINVRGTVFTAQKAVELMTGGGSIILNGSAAAVKAMPGSSLYSASKNALAALARVWSAELADRRIRVNVLHPGPIDTAALQTITPEHRDHLVALTTIGRLGRPDEIATAVLFLACADSSFVSGTELFAGGGMGQS
ncbi:SDR family NAD(P)-dependent oxidoreductase [Amycolatopsis sp. WQ 127309]|uniref:SDR family NAD(P)-dependent oxidoreductase n=1 Tax=Amycolatopsis sp. WQ 127309 TaxID=2932773 RepID=UPI001FF5D646|nr:SDR family oxidoreductase [Amycolatopsis sp. WQ 127309]UOZ06034.1 SDR family oxidoreductase [Amycolatopsis sp. WQ 127309]